jgi:DNA-binding transcriptional LysR family regulator
MGKALQTWESRIGRRLKLRDLHILSVAVQWGSMARAASQLAMSQPAVSQSVASLEATLGVRLLDRTSRGVEPTLYAQALLKRGHVVFDELMQGVRDIEFLANPQVGEIRVASGDTAAAGLLATVIDRLSRRHPQLVVRVVPASAETLEYPELRERAVDVALARLSRSFAQGDLQVETLFDDPSRVVVGALSPWARRRKVSLAELVDEPWIFTSDQVIRGLIAEAFASQGLEAPREKVSASSMLLRSRLLATGRYLTVLPDSVLRCNARQWSLKALPVELGMKPMRVAIITLRNRTVSPVVQLFIEQVRAVANRHAPVGSVQF